MSTLNFILLSTFLAGCLCLAGQYYDYISIKNITIVQDTTEKDNLKCANSLDCNLISDFKYYDAIYKN